MTEYRQQAEGPPPAIEPSAPLGSRDNPLPFRIFKKCPLCGEGPTAHYGIISKSVVPHKGQTLLEHRHAGTGCSGTWFTHTALTTTTVRDSGGLSGGLRVEPMPARILIAGAVSFVLAIGGIFFTIFGGGR